MPSNQIRRLSCEEEGPMKILVVGDGHSAIHEVAVMAAFKKLGHQIESFYWHEYFKSRNPIGRLIRRAQNKFLVGEMIYKLNHDLIRMAILFEPKLIFIYRGTHILPKTLLALKKELPDCKIFGYNNDDPFAVGHHFWLWRHFLKGVPIYDLIFAYRKHNLIEYYDSGAKKVELLMPWFLPENDKPQTAGENIHKKFDVVFVGHYENDQRIEYLKNVAESQYISGLFGPDWDLAPEYSWLKKYIPVVPVRGELYRETLISAKIALCFLSSLNRDTYTRRCFEIPAMGVFMLCQYSDDLVNLFEDGVDAVFFHSPSDMMEKLAHYTLHDDLREKIAANGRARVVRDEHDIVSRMQYVMSFLAKEES